MKNYIKRNGKPDVIVIDESKFTADDLIKLDEYRELSFRLHILYKCFYDYLVTNDNLINARLFILVETEANHITCVSCCPI